jgi:prepilin-type N-terminal cleavage/methylation domain-containing protein
MQSRQTIEGHARTETGFTIVEMVVAISVFTIVMASIYGLLEVGRRGRTNTLQRNEVVQNARIALNYVGRDALNAGVSFPNAGVLVPDNALSGLGLEPAVDADPDFDVLTPVVGTNAIDVVNGVQTDRVTFAYVDDSFNKGDGLPIDQIDVVGTNGLLRVRDPGDNTEVTVGDTYMITGINGYAMVTATGLQGVNEILVSGGDPLSLNIVDLGVPSALRSVLALAAGCGTCATSASLSRIRWVTYHLNPDGNGSGTLMRRIYGGRDAGGNPIASSDQPLAFGVDSFQVSYVLRDGTVVDSPTRDPLLDQMQLIRQVRVTVNVSSPDLDPRTGQPFRSTLVTAWSTRNLEYEKQ